MLIEREERLRWRRNKSREREKRGQVTDKKDGERGGCDV